jgi:hypothetical protein
VTIASAPPEGRDGAGYNPKDLILASEILKIRNLAEMAATPLQDEPARRPGWPKGVTSCLKKDGGLRYR